MCVKCIVFFAVLSSPYLFINAAVSSCLGGFL